MNKLVPITLESGTRFVSSRSALGVSKGSASVKSFDSRAYSINDFVEWDNGKQLELSPKFQRRSVWSDKADPPPLKWSALKYGFEPTRGWTNAEEDPQA